jgi:hypothetical protein
VLPRWVFNVPEEAYPPFKLTLLENGNLVLMDSVGKVQWASQTACLGTTWGNYTMMVRGRAPAFCCCLPAVAGEPCSNREHAAAAAAAAAAGRLGNLAHDLWPLAARRSPPLPRAPQVTDLNVAIMDGNGKTIWTLLPSTCPTGYTYQVLSSASQQQACIRSGPTPASLALRR